jgi:hypothetical protein
MTEKFSIEIPEDMIRNLSLEFSDINRPEKMHELHAIREAIATVFETLDEEPELIYDDDFYDDLTKSFAIKLVLERMNCFYSS